MGNYNHILDIYAYLQQSIFLYRVTVTFASSFLILKDVFNAPVTLQVVVPATTEGSKNRGRILYFLETQPGTSM